MVSEARPGLRRAGEARQGVLANVGRLRTGPGLAPVHTNINTPFTNGTRSRLPAEPALSSSNLLHGLREVTKPRWASETFLH